MGPTITVDAEPARRIGSWDAVVRRFLTLACGEGSGRLIAVAATILMAHRLTPSDFGVVMLGLLLSAWFSTTVDAGTETLGTREISRDPGRLREVAEPILGLRLPRTTAGKFVRGLVAEDTAQTVDATR